MFRLENPQFLYLLIVVIALLLLQLYFNINNRNRIKKFAKKSTLKLMMPEFSLKRSYLKTGIIFLALFFGIIVLARPQFGTKVEKVEKEGIEMVIAMDVSNSMMSNDIQPNRLSRAKQILSKIIDERKNDKIAIIVFAGESFVQMPLTSDVLSAKVFLDNISPDLVPVQGTAISEALTNSLSLFSGEENVDRSVVLITDGEDHEGQDVKTAKELSQKGIMVNVMGVGTPNGGRIPIGNNDYMKDNDGNIVLTKLNEERCVDLAKAGNGIYVRADNTSSAIKAISDRLETLQKKKMSTNIYSDYSEKFIFFAWIFFILIFVEILIFDKKNRLFKNIRIIK